MIGKKPFFVVYLLLAGAVLFLNLHQDLTVPINRPLEQFPKTLNQWRMVGESKLSDDVQQKLKASDVLCRQYENPQGEKVTLYIGYHGGGKGSGEIHSPKQCLPGGGWFHLAEARKQLPVPEGNVKFVEAVYKKGDSKELFLYWYQVRDKSLSDEYSLKFEEIANSVLYRRRDASFVRISVPFEGEDAHAAELGRRFASDFYAAIRSFLPS